MFFIISTAPMVCSIRTHLIKKNQSNSNNNTRFVFIKLTFVFFLYNLYFLYFILGRICAPYLFLCHFRKSLKSPKLLLNVSQGWQPIVNDEISTHHSIITMEYYRFTY